MTLHRQVEDFCVLSKIVIKKKHLLKLRVWLNQICWLFSNYVGSSETAVMSVADAVKQAVLSEKPLKALPRAFEFTSSSHSEGGRPCSYYSPVIGCSYSYFGGFNWAWETWMTLANKWIMRNVKEVESG